MDYKKIYPLSWNLTRKNYQTLIFGLLASLLGFYEIQILFNLDRATPNFIGSLIISWFDVFSVFSTVNLSFATISGFAALLGIFIVFALLAIAAISSQGALIHIAGQAESKKLNFFQSLQLGIDKFWPLLGLNVINTLIGYFFLSMIVSPLLEISLASSSAASHILSAILVFFVIVPLIVILSFVTRYGAGYVILKNQNIFEAFVNSWYLFWKNWLVTIENAAFIIFLTALYYLVLFAALVFIFVPFLVLAAFLGFDTIIFWLVVLSGGLISVAVLILGFAFFGAYYNLIWTRIYIDLESPTPSRSKLHSLAHKHLPELTR